MAMSVGLFAQKGEKSIGLRGGYDVDNGNFGAGIQLNYNLTNHLRVAPNFNYFFEKDGFTTYDANIDFQYLIPITQRLKLYPIVGASMIHGKTETSITIDGSKKTVTNKDTEFGANLGAGVQFDFCKRWFVHADYTYKWMSNLDRSNVALGVGWKF